MSILAQNHTDEVALLDCIQKFFAKHHVGKLLKQCNGTKEKGVPSISLLKYKLGNIFIGRSMYMQQRTGSFKEDFSKNTLDLSMLALQRTRKILANANFDAMMIY